MKNFLAATFVVALSLLLILAGFFYFFFNTTAGFEWMIESAWAKVFPNHRLTVFSVERVRTNPFRGMEIQGLQVKIKGFKGRLSVRKLGFEMPPEGRFRTPIFWVEGLDFKTKDLSVLGGEIKLGRETGQATPTGFGSIAASKLTLQSQYSFQNLQGIISKWEPLTVHPFQGEFSKGKLEGEIYYSGQNEGRIEIRGKLTEADLSGLAKMKGELFKNARGRYEGEFYLVLEKGRLKEVSMSAQAPKPGGELNAELFRILLNYLPSNADRKHIEGLIQTRKTLPFDEARFFLKNKTDKSLEAEVNIVSKTLNLNLNVNFEINFEEASDMQALGRVLQAMGAGNE